MRHIKCSKLRRCGVVVNSLLTGHRIDRNFDSRVLMISPVERYSMVGEDWRWDELCWRVHTH